MTIRIDFINTKNVLQYVSQLINKTMQNTVENVLKCPQESTESLEMQKGQTRININICLKQRYKKIKEVAFTTSRHIEELCMTLVWLVPACVSFKRLPGFSYSHSKFKLYYDNYTYSVSLIVNQIQLEEPEDFQFPCFLDRQLRFFTNILLDSSVVASLR